MNIFEKAVVCLVIGGSLAYVNRFALENSAMFGIQIAVTIFFLWSLVKPFEKFTIIFIEHIRSAIYGKEN